MLDYNADDLLILAAYYMYKCSYFPPVQALLQIIFTKHERYHVVPGVFILKMLWLITIKHSPRTLSPFCLADTFSGAGGLWTAPLSLIYGPNTDQTQ